MRGKATLEQAERIHAILGEVEFDGSPNFGYNWPQAVKLCFEITGYIPPSRCSSCRHNVHDRLRKAVGLSIARKPDESLRQQRMAICHKCPVYHPSTDSCGRLILDAISPKEVDGVKPCGCVISLKAAFTSERCPANRWPA